MISELALTESGYLAALIPEQYGGAASTFTMACIAVEELGRIDGSVSVLADVQNTLVTNAMLKWATDEQKEKYLPLMAEKWVNYQ